MSAVIVEVMTTVLLPVACDLCRAEGKITEATHDLGSAFVCADHLDGPAVPLVVVDRTFTVAEIEAMDYDEATDYAEAVMEQVR